MGDTHRRILLARLDTQIETPFKREFEFDPLTEICNNRQVLMVAALTIAQAYITAGHPKVGKGLADGCATDSSEGHFA